jgi:8-oxo-dGTP pyrophosphatase MutT (NUDIX family)
VPDLDQLSADEIRDRLHAQGGRTYDVPPEMLSDSAREAAVLMPFLRIEEAWHILYIRRAHCEGDRHSGQVAFAGGKREASDDSLLTTALRETEEEVGIAANDIEVLGHINHHHTISEFQVRPYVGVVPWPYRARVYDSAQLAGARIQLPHRGAPAPGIPAAVADCLLRPLRWRDAVGRDRAYDAVADRFVTRPVNTPEPARQSWLEDSD